MDGVLREDLMEAGTLTFPQINQHHKVEIVLIPLKPTQVTIEKTAVNKTDPGKPTQVNDIITYTISVANELEYSLWQDVYVRDVIPEGIPNTGDYSFVYRYGILAMASGLMLGGLWIYRKRRRI